MARNVLLILALCSDFSITDGAHYRCNQLRYSYDVARDLRSENLVTAVEALRPFRSFNQSHMVFLNTQSSCVMPQSDRYDCEADLCYHLMYRTMDGSCNNFDHPNWGAAFTQLKRLRPPVYDDDKGIPTGIDKPGKPTSRDASRLLLSAEKEVYDTRYNELLMVWGQFLAHDITKTSKIESNVTCESCFPPDQSHCIAVKVPSHDPGQREFGCQEVTFTGEIIPRLICCIRSTRSAPVCGTGSTVSSPREQYNENTAYIDASMIYGSSVADMKRLREGNTGFMKIGKIDGTDYLPFNTSLCNDENCTVQFFAGDQRVDLFSGLAAIHVIFLRHHNKLAKDLQRLNPHWNGDRLFQETRKIMGAIIQKITFDDWLPKILGPSEFSRRIGSYRYYDRYADATISNVFATSALRFGHGMILKHFFRLDNDGIELPERGVDVLDAVFNSTKIVKEGGIDPVINGIQASKVKVPRGVAKVLTRRLFGNTDLTAVNIERGREHGLPGYNTWRKYCELADARQFQDLAQEIPVHQTRILLELMYFTTDTIDLYVAQLLEKAVSEGLVGPTVACLISRQFNALRNGDRFWYENPTVFTHEQRQSIKGASLSGIICDNSDGMRNVPAKAFEYSPNYEYMPCRKLPRMDLNPWKER